MPTIFLLKEFNVHLNQLFGLRVASMFRKDFVIDNDMTIVSVWRIFLLELLKKGIGISIL